MKRTALVRQIKRAARTRGLRFDKIRSRDDHDIYTLDGLIIPTSRHREIAEGLARRIRSEYKPKLGRNWWR